MWNNQQPDQNVTPGWQEPRGAHPPAPVVRFNLVLPVTRIGAGLFSFDPLEQLLGTTLEHILQPAMVGPVFQRPSASGPSVRVFPLGIPPGEGLSMSLGQFGCLGFSNDAGYLRIIVPLQAGPWVHQRLAHAVVRGPERALSDDGSSWVAWLWILLQPGMGLGLPVAGLGEIGIEAG